MIPAPETQEVQTAKQCTLQKRWLHLGLALLVYLSFATYYETLNYGFVWDDQKFILEDPYIKDLSNIPRYFVRGFTLRKDSRVPYYRPLIMVSYTIEYHIWGVKSFGYHLTNVLLHTAAVVLLFLFLRKLFSDPLIPLCAGIIFVLHPVHTESVAWIAGRTDIMCSVFVFLSILIYLNAEKFSGRSRILLVASSIFTFVLALSSKESGATLPFFLAGIAFYRQREGNLRERIKGVIKFTLPFIAVLPFYLAARAVILRGTDIGSFNPSVMQGMLATLFVIPRYLRLLFYPVDLQAYYVHKKPESFLEDRILFSISLLLFIFLVFYHFRRQLRDEIFAFCSIILLLLPVFPFRPFFGALMAERFLYLPSSGFALFLALCFVRIYRYGLPARFIYYGRLLFLVLFVTFGIWYSILTAQANQKWTNQVVFFKKMVEDYPFLVFAKKNLVKGYLNWRDYTKAIPHLEAAAKLDKNNQDIFTGLGKAYRKVNKPDLAIKAWKRALEINPRDVLAYKELGEIVSSQGDWQEAIVHWEKAASLDSTNAEVLYNLGKGYEKIGNLEQATKYYRLFVTRSSKKSKEVEEVKNRIEVFTKLTQKKASGPKF